jgi:predicted ATP-dependent serine protease
VSDDEEPDFGEEDDADEEEGESEPELDEGGEPVPPPPKPPKMLYRCGGHRRKDDDENSYCDYRAHYQWTGNCPGNPEIVFGKKRREILDALAAGKGCGWPFNSEPIGKGGGGARKSLAKLATRKPPPRISTGLPEIDYVLNGGLVRGSTIVFTGPSGTGKTTVLLQIANAVAAHFAEKNPDPDAVHVLYASAEQSADDLGMFAQRIGGAHPNVGVMGNAEEIGAVTEEAIEVKPKLLIVDSAAMFSQADAGGNVGSAEQVRTIALWLQTHGKRYKASTILVMHVTKTGEMAGPNFVTHAVDGAIRMDPCYDDKIKDPQLVKDVRVFESMDKYRWGPSGVVSRMEMTAEGLKPLSPRLARLFSTLELV